MVAYRIEKWGMQIWEHKQKVVPVDMLNTVDRSFVLSQFDERNSFERTAQRFRPSGHRPRLLEVRSRRDRMTASQLEQSQNRVAGSRVTESSNRFSILLCPHCVLQDCQPRGNTVDVRRD